MRIDAITQKVIKTGITAVNKNRPQGIVQSSDTVTCPMDCFVPSFKGINLNKMYEEYNWYIHHDNVPAIKSYLRMTYPKEVMEEFLTHILETKDRGYELIESIVAKPREINKRTEELGEKVGRNSKITLLKKNMKTAA